MQSFLAPLCHSLFFSMTWGKKWGGLLAYKLSWMYQMLCSLNLFVKSLIKFTF